MKYYGILVTFALIGFLVVVTRGPYVTVRAANGKAYAVRRQPGCQDVARRLGELEDHVRSFLDAVDGIIPGDPRIAAIRRRWRGGFSEVAYGSSTIAYSVDKDDIHICVRNADGHLEDLNNVMYVALHELAHVCTSEYGHTPLFWANFRWLLEVAEATKHYTYAEHGAETYCGHPLGENVIQCVRAKTCESQVRTASPNRKSEPQVTVKH